MEAGYDYLLVRSRLQHSFIRASAIFLVVTGAVLVAAGIAYYVYAYKARSGLGELEFALPQAADVALPATPAESAPAGALPVAQPGAVTQLEVVTQPDVATQPDVVAPPDVVTQPDVVGQPEVVSRVDVVPEPNLVLQPNVVPQAHVVPQPDVKIVSIEPEPQADVTSPINGGMAHVPYKDAVDRLTALRASSQPPAISPSALEAQKVYPAGSIKATSWGNPLEYEPTSFIESSLIQAFRPVHASRGAAPGALSALSRLIIPAIGVDSEVSELAVLDLGDSRAYQTPNQTVGHIPETSNPGERGGAWPFGHLESPLEGEGNVFYEMPKIPGLLRKGEVVYAIVESGSTSYLYKLSEAFVVHQDKLTLDYRGLQQLKPEFANLTAGNANLHLVVCVPRFVYDYRLVVSGQLVGIKTG